MTLATLARSARRAAAGVAHGRARPVATPKSGAAAAARKPVAKPQPTAPVVDRLAPYRMQAQAEWDRAPIALGWRGAIPERREFSVGAGTYDGFGYENQTMVAWTREAYLEQRAKALAGDPGPSVPDWR